MKKLDIVYMGTPEFAVAPLEALLKDEQFEVLAVVSQPDKAQGRRMQMVETPVKRVALAHGVRVLQPVKLKDGQLEADLRALHPDFLVTCAYGRILPESLLKIPKYEALNLHASLLPKYRGAAPIQWTLLNGDEEAGVSLMRMDVELDHGAVFAKEIISVEKEDNYETLSDKLSKLAAEIAVKYIPRIAREDLLGVEQAHENATFTRILKREDGEINWENSAEVIERQVRACYPWPGTYSFLDGKRLKIFTVKEIDLATLDQINTQNSAHPRVGTLLKDKKRLLVVCGAEEKSFLEILELQAEGGKRLSAHDFMQRLKGDEVLGADV